MEIKRKRWQPLLILAVLLVTLYNVLPTVIYYSKPLSQPIDSSQALAIQQEIVERLRFVEQDSQEWIKAYTSYISTPVQSLSTHPDDSQKFVATFYNSTAAERFKMLLPAAGARILFPPMRLTTAAHQPFASPNTVYIERLLPISLDSVDTQELFSHINLYDQFGQPSDEYKSIISYRVNGILRSLLGPTPQAQQLTLLSNAKDIPLTTAKGVLADTAVSISKAHKVFDNNSKLFDLYLSSLFSSSSTYNWFVQSISHIQGEELDALTEPQKQAIKKSISILPTSLVVDSSSINIDQLQNQLMENQFTSLNGAHPVVGSISLDWLDQSVQIRLNENWRALYEDQNDDEVRFFQWKFANQMIQNHFSMVNATTDEKIVSQFGEFDLKLTEKPNTKSLIVFNLQPLYKTIQGSILSYISKEWQPASAALKQSEYAARSMNEFVKQSPVEQSFGIVAYSPAFDNAPFSSSRFRDGSIYFVARGLAAIARDEDNKSDEEKNKLLQDVQNLQRILMGKGMLAHPGAIFFDAPELKDDIIFEMPFYYSSLLEATREDFRTLPGTGLSLLELSDYEQRLITINRIEDEIQEELIKWGDEYQAAQVDLDEMQKLLVPPPIKNIYWSNLKLGVRKYFRGNQNHILKWGLDLSGGKTVRVSLEDDQKQPVKDPADLERVSTELYARINKLGIAERSIRVENDQIVLEFPGSQNLSASDLIQASKMTFHLVNEKFGPMHSDLWDVANTFLTEVWNEATLTNRTNVEQLNEIALSYLGQEDESIESEPRTESARILKENGLLFASDDSPLPSGSFNETYSMIAKMRGSAPSDWKGQSHPLMIVFRNWALEGSSLKDVYPSYDPSQGNILHFSVKSSYSDPRLSSHNPQNDFYEWTSQFAEDKVQGTLREKFSRGRGWRMAVILNDEVINAPTLNGALSNQGTISGQFSQLEINKLASDLKAGSLSFTPRILSETNISPQLGLKERSQGIFAAILGLTLVVVSMVIYYKKGGVVASLALIFNILIIWGSLQSFGAALTLPGLAGIILTIGMSVDANVIVFERVREELNAGSKLAGAIYEGYKKAFSAILDSNVTTFLAALILVQFDSGPVKGFAVTLMIGIISSMFTSLFMTRQILTSRVESGKMKSFEMHSFFKNPSIDFLSLSKVVVMTSVAISLVGSALTFKHWNTLLGMDFTGGYSLVVDLKSSPESSNTFYKTSVVSNLINVGFDDTDLDVRVLDRPNHLLIRVGLSAESEGRPFFNLPEVQSYDSDTYRYLSNPRIQLLVDAIEKKGIELDENSLDSLDASWSVMSSSFSNSMKMNALYAIGLSMLGILIYVAFRFEWAFSIAAVIALIHDVIVSMSLLAIFHLLGFAVQIDLQVVGAIMTIIGYSLNDTIIVFDRIREKSKYERKASFHQICNDSLNITLSRTLLTSGTTLLTLLPLVIFGGASIFTFSLVMTLGVVFGTLSSLFIATPVMLRFHEGINQ